MSCRTILTTLAITLTVAAVAPAQAGDKRIDLPDGWQPEGIASHGKSLFVGSIPTGDVLELDPRSGDYETVVDAPDGRAAIGIDVTGNRIVAAGGPTGSVFFYDRRTGDPVAQFAVGQAGNTFVNDLERYKGAYYTTDSRRAVIYRVAPNGATEIPVPDVPADDQFNLNGIEAGRGFLIAVHSTDGDLYRIDPATGESLKVDLGGAKLTNGDGLLLKGRTLYVVRNRLNQIAVVELGKRFASGELVGAIASDDFDVPTTVARQGKSLYAVNARFGTAEPESADYWVTRVSAKASR